MANHEVLTAGITHEDGTDGPLTKEWIIEGGPKRMVSVMHMLLDLSEALGQAATLYAAGLLGDDDHRAALAAAVRLIGFAPISDMSPVMTGATAFAYLDGARGLMRQCDAQFHALNLMEDIAAGNMPDDFDAVVAEARGHDG